MVYGFNHYYKLQNVWTRRYVNIRGSYKNGATK